MKWFRGETAPKDGTKILAWTGLGYELTEWCRMKHYDYEPVGDGLYRRVETISEFWNSNSPLWWMPLPPPPEGAELPPEMAGFED